MTRTEEPTFRLAALAAGASITSLSLLANYILTGERRAKTNDYIDGLSTEMENVMADLKESIGQGGWIWN